SPGGDGEGCGAAHFAPDWLSGTVPKTELKRAAARHCSSAILPVQLHVQDFRFASARRSVMNAKEEVRKLLTLADIELNGPDPWDIQVHDERFYQRVISHGSLALGESYMDGWWDVEQLDEFFSKVQKARLNEKKRGLPALWLFAKGRLFNRQTKSASRRVAQEHYDLGNDLYQVMLDKNMQYTCAYWKDAKTLDEAQEKYACELCDGLPIRFEEKDYREAIHEPQFDRVVAVGLCEHIGHKNHRSFFELAHAKLKNGGLFVL